MFLNQKTAGENPCWFFISKQILYKIDIGLSVVITHDRA